MKFDRRYFYLLIILSLWISSGCDPFSHSTCKWGRTFSEQLSPDQLFRADVYGWVCKPDTDKVTMMRVDIVRTNEFGSSETVFSTDGKYTITTTWLDSRHLLIQCEGMPPGVENSRKDHWEEVKVSYKC